MHKSAGPTSSAYWTASARAERAQHYARRLGKAPGCSCPALEQCKEKLKKLEIELLESRRKKISLQQHKSRARAVSLRRSGQHPERYEREARRTPRGGGKKRRRRKKQKGGWFPPGATDETEHCVDNDKYCPAIMIRLEGGSEFVNIPYPFIEEELFSTHFRKELSSGRRESGLKDRTMGEIFGDIKLSDLPEINGNVIWDEVLGLDTSETLNLQMSLKDLIERKQSAGKHIGINVNRWRAGLPALSGVPYQVRGAENYRPLNLLTDITSERTGLPLGWRVTIKDFDARREQVSPLNIYLGATNDADAVVRIDKFNLGWMERKGRTPVYTIDGGFDTTTLVVRFPGVEVVNLVQARLQQLRSGNESAHLPSRASSVSSGSIVSSADELHSISSSSSSGSSSSSSSSGSSSGSGSSSDSSSIGRLSDVSGGTRRKKRTRKRRKKHKKRKKRKTRKRRKKRYRRRTRKRH